MSNNENKSHYIKSNIRKYFGVTVKEVGAEAKKAGVKVNDYYNTLYDVFYKDHIKEKRVETLNKNKSRAKFMNTLKQKFASNKIKAAFNKYLDDKYKNFTLITALDKKIKHYGFDFTNGKTEKEIYLLSQGNRKYLPQSLQVLNKRSFMKNQVNDILKPLLPIKVSLCVKVLLLDILPEDNEYFRFLNRYIHSDYEVLLNENDINNIIENLSIQIDDIITNINSVKFIGILNYYIKIAEYNPIGGGSYFDLPCSLKKKLALKNIKNNDEMCFKYGLEFGLNRDFLKDKEHTERVSTYNNLPNKLLIPQGCQFPPQYRDYYKYEKLNNIKIVIFSCSTKNKCKEGDKEYTTILPLYNNNNIVDIDGTNTHYLLLIENHKTLQEHYVYITNMSRLFTRENTKGHHAENHYCPNCLSRFTSKQGLIKHFENKCFDNPLARAVMPTIDKDGNKPIMEFKNYQNRNKLPTVIYADCESILEPVNVGTSGNMKKINEHKPASFHYVIVSENRKKIDRKFVGRNCLEDFLENLISDCENIQNDYRKTNKPIVMTVENEKNFKNADNCYMCNNHFSEDNQKVRDHDHLTGNFRGAACNSCNLKCRNDRLSIPIYFHNGKGYDFHHIIKCIGSVLKNKKYNLSCIPLNTENFLTIKVNTINLMFKDSNQFLSSSIEKLVELLKKSDNAYSNNIFKHTRKYFSDKGYSEDDIQLLLQKGYFPYEWFDSFDKLNYDGLPPIEKFYSRLNNKGLTISEYLHSKLVYKKFNCKSFKDYHDIYLSCDVYLLADIFENYRELCLEHFKLDPAHYITNPGMFWDAALLKSGVQLELLTNIDMYLMFEQGIRGGISMISKRHAKANIPNINGYDPSQPNSYISYFDANNLYGHAMVRKLPTHGFKYDDVNKFTLNYILNFKGEDSGIGYVLDVDLKYPKELHDKHNAYPLAPERMKVLKSMLSPYNIDVSKANGLKILENEKLVPNLMDKKNYVVHIETLKSYLEQGLILEKVNKVIAFNQSNWLSDYVMYNTKQRIIAKQQGNEFLSNLYKLANNSVFGKTMENVRHRMNLELVSRTDKFLTKKLASPKLQNIKIFSEDLVAIQNKKQEVVLNKPIYVGFTILDLSKEHMYKFHYNTMLRKYDYKNCELLFTDTDSLCYHITTPNLIEDLKDIKDEFDFSEYDKNHPLYSPDNLAVLGKMKDEAKGMYVEDFYGLNPKTYFLTFFDSKKNKQENINKAKGIKKYITKTYTSENYKNVIINKEADKNVVQHSIRSTTTKDNKHQLWTIEQKRIGLTPIDTKRYLLDDGINSYAYGHYKIV
jgi:hypothetical protein